MKNFGLFGYFSLAFICGFFSSSTYARGTGEEFCNSVASTLNRDYPRKGRFFTINAPVCESNNGKDFYIRQIYTINKTTNLSSDQVVAMVNSVSTPLTQSMCAQKEITDFLQLMNYRVDFISEGGASASHQITLNEAKCKEVNLGAIDSCTKIAQVLKNSLPSKVSDELTRVDVKCRSGLTKPAAMVIYERINIDRPLSQIEAMFQQPKVRNDLIKSRCGSTSFVNSLNQHDVVFVYVFKDKEVGEISISKKDCDGPN